MIITQTPFRMSFFGGGTDYEGFYREHGGSVISTTFDKYCYVNVRHLPKFFEYRTHLSYSKMEYVNTYDEIEHPAIREAMRFLNMHELHVAYDADLPARSGLGTSSSFAVGMLNAFHALKGKYVDKKTLADEAIYLERVLCRESGGIQDQIAASFGGLNRIQFSGKGYEVRPIIISPERKDQLDQNLILFFTGFSRISSEIAKIQEKAVRDKNKELLELLDLVDEAEEILTGKGELCEFGKLLNETWEIKRGITSKISNDSIDLLYQKAMNAGALGGKLLGAGGGGFLLFYVEPERQKAVMEELHNLLYVPFHFESYGTRIIQYAPEFWQETQE